MSRWQQQLGCGLSKTFIGETSLYQWLHGGLAVSISRLLTRDHSLTMFIEAECCGWQKGGWRSVAGK